MDQNIQDNIESGAAQILQKKVEHLSSTLESIGIGGIGIIKGSQKVKQLYDKWKGKKQNDEEDQKEESGEQDSTATEPAQTESTPQGDTPPVNPEESSAGTEGEPNAEQPDIEEEPDGPMDLTGDVDFDGTFARGLPEITGPSFPEGDETLGDRPVEVNLNPPGSQYNPTQPAQPETNVEVAEPTSTNGFVEQMELDPESVGQGGTSTSLSSGGEGGQTAAQTQIQDLDPEGASNLLSGAGGDDAANALVDAGGEAGSSLLDTGLAIGDAVLDAIPFVGEIALVGTAIAGFFEALFGESHTPATEITGKEGVDADALVQSQTPVTAQV
jgi:hypothetical protein